MLCWCFCDDDDSLLYNGFTFFKYLRKTSLARLTEDPDMFSGPRTLLSLTRKTDENRERDERYLLGFLKWVVEVEEEEVYLRRLSSSSAVAEEGREEEEEVSESVAEEGREEEEEVEGREEEVTVVAEEEVEEEERRRERTMERRGERWRGRSWPL